MLGCVRYENVNQRNSFSKLLLVMVLVTAKDSRLEKAETLNARLEKNVNSETEKGVWFPGGWSWRVGAPARDTYLVL